MRIAKKYISAVLCMVLFLGCFASLEAKALTYPVKGIITSLANIYSLPGTTGHEANAADKGKSQHIAALSAGTEVMVLGEAIDGDGDKWYKINFGSAYEKTGYAYETKLELKPEYVYNEEFEKTLLSFPESYRSALRALHAKYPNWKFVPHRVNMTFKEAVESQYGVSKVTDTRKWVEFKSYGQNWCDIRAYNCATNSGIILESRWTYASRAAIEYYMDPRNSLDENNILVFMQQSYQKSSDEKDLLRTIVKGTFLEKGYDKNANGSIESSEKDAYINDIISAGQKSGVSPYVLAATIIVEQGTLGNTNMVSGKYPGYEGYYNFFNFNASGSNTAEISASALAYAKQKGWNSRTAAIEGGAQLYVDGYINAGQDTYYYKDFNVVNKIWWHQYASALYDAWTNANYLRKGCVANTNAALTFKIPVYNNRPATAAPHPDSGKTTTGDIEIDESNLPVASEWSIKLNETGVFSLKPTYFLGEYSIYDIVVTDKNNNEIGLNIEKGGWPLVKNQNYTIRFRYEEQNKTTKNTVWEKTKKASTIFPDTGTNLWYSDAVAYVAGRGIITGYNNGLFGTSDSIQRQDFLVMLARLDGVNLLQYANKHGQFPDVAENSYYESAVMWGYENKIVTGYDDGKFGVGDKVTREQLVTFLCRYAEYKGLDVSYNDTTVESVSNKYTDFINVSSFAKDSILWAIENGVISGKTDTTIAPIGNAQRCEVAQIMYNIYLNDIFE